MFFQIWFIEIQNESTFGKEMKHIYKVNLSKRSEVTCTMILSYMCQNDCKNGKRGKV